MIPEETISQIRDRADIVQVIGQYVQLKKAGRNFKGLCPFHGEKTPSFSVSPDKGFFHCFGCQKQGDVFTFVMELEGKSFVEVAEQLGARFGVELPKIEESPELRRQRGERVAMLDINKLAMQFYRELLATPKGEPGRAYLAKRGVGDEVAAKFQLGFAPAEWDLLAEHLRSKRVDMELAVKLGLVAQRPRAGGYYDRYRERLVCPVIVPGGEVHGFSCRVVGASSPGATNDAPKYINSPESTVYKKSRLLFGLAQAREGMQASRRCVIVEGNFDVVTLHQAGFTEVVAPLGTAITAEQILLLKRMVDRVVLVYDGDRAGYKATMHALELCVEAEVEVLVAARPGNAKSGGAGALAASSSVTEGVDPDSMVSSGGGEQLREAIDRAIGGFEFMCFEVWGKAHDSAERRARALNEAAKIVGKVADPTKRNLIVGTLASALKVSVDVAWGAMGRGGGAGQGHPSGQGRGGPREAVPGSTGDQTGRPDQAGPSGKPPPTEEVEVLTLLADHPSLIASADADKAFWLLTDARLRDMYSAARDGLSFSELASRLPTESAKLVLSAKYVESKNPEAQLASMVGGLAERKAARERAELLNSLSDAHRRGDRELARQLAQQATSSRKQVD